MLDADSQELTTINTEKGLFSYTRLPFGISAASAIFQRTIDTILQGIPQTVAYLDDILITGKDQEDHLKNLNAVLHRLEEHGLRLRKDKCTFMEPTVTYLGHMIDSQGIHPTDEKTKAIQEAATPCNVSELRSYIGLLNYYHKFLPNLSTLLAPLYELLNKNIPWKWGNEQKEAFDKSKDLLRSSSLLVHYNPSLPIVVTSDASPVGIGSVLSHIMPDGTEKPIMFSSRTLNSAERNYSQVEKEGLGVIFGVKQFHKYLFGRKFTIFTDHKPLIGLFRMDKTTSNMAPSRLIRWSLQLGAYMYQIKYSPGKDLGNADALSRLPRSVVPKLAPEPAEVILVMKRMDLSPITSKEIAKETHSDHILSRVYHFVLTGWPEQLSEGDIDIKPYFHRRAELSCHDRCLLWGTRVIVPDKFHATVLDELHDTHPGIVKMKSLSRSYVWWPGLDKDIERTVHNCSLCQTLGNKPPVAPLNPWEWPTKPWDRLHVDYAGPIDGKMLLIIIDAGTKYIDAHVVNSATSESTVEKLRHTFALLGLPRTIVSDNGTPFTGEAFENFCVKNGIKHVCVSPYHAASNGMAERAVQGVKLGLKKAGPGSLETKLYRYLLNYHKTPQSTTGVSPSELLQKRHLRSRIDMIKPDLSTSIQDKQVKMKKRHDIRAKERVFHCGDPVMAYDFLHSPKWKPGVVEEILGPVTYRIQLLDGRTWRRHVDHLKLRYEDFVNGKPQTAPVPPPLHPPVPSNESSEKGGEEQQIVPVEHSPIEPVMEPPKTPKTPKVLSPQTPPKVLSPPTPKVLPRRSARERRAPEKLNI